MAHLTQQEFTQAIELLASDGGLQRLRDRFVRLNALVTRRRAASPRHLADQLYMLTSGLRRQVPATLAFHSLWGERLREKLGGEEGEKDLEPLADKINACLGERDRLLAEKEADLEAALRAYESTLSAKAGAETARLDMLLKAVPDVAKKLRDMPPTPPGSVAVEAASAAAAESAGEESAAAERKEEPRAEPAAEAPETKRKKSPPAKE
jgi:hypothetical protein